MGNVVLRNVITATWSVKDGDETIITIIKIIHEHNPIHRITGIRLRAAVHRSMKPKDNHKYNLTG